MSEEKIYEGVEYEGVEVEETVVEEAVVTEPVVAKKGLAKASLVLGILAFITTLFVVNYIFGIIALICGIVYLTKKADVKPKGKAIAGIVLASLSLIISTTVWISAYVYVTKTGITQIVEDVAGLMGEEVDGREMVNQVVAEATGGAISLDTIEQFVGGEVSVERILNFVGDVSKEEINSFINEINTMDQATMQAIMQEFSGEVTYEKLEEKLGKDFSLEELMAYIRSFSGTTQE